MNKSGLISLISVGLLSLSCEAFSAVSNDASSVVYEKSCVIVVNEVDSEENNENDDITIDNCFDNVTDLRSWVNTIRKPGPMSPLEIQFGLGQHNFEEGGLKFLCSNNSYEGHIAIKGLGRKQSILYTNSGFNMNFKGCSEISVSNLTIRNTNSTSGGAILWNGGGNSNWTNVEVDAQYYAWDERMCGLVRGQHYWHSSVIKNQYHQTGKAYRGKCDESWFIGTEITQTDENHLGTNIANSLIALDISGNAIAHVYGSVIRVIANSVVNSNNITASGGNNTQAGDGSGAMAAAYAYDGGRIHIHGSAIDVISHASNNISALVATNGGHIHAPGTSFNLFTAEGGVINRLFKGTNGHIHSPYLWQTSAEPPVINSITGSDMVIVTNIDEGKPHTLEYDTNCSGTWWPMG